MSKLFIEMQYVCVCVLGILLDWAAAQRLQPNDVIFYLTNRNHPMQGFPITPDSMSITKSDFSLQKVTIVTIHDYGEGAQSRFNNFVVPQLLYNQDANVIIVDWSVGCRDYKNGFYNTIIAGYYIANLLKVLATEFGYSYNNFQIIGFGLGAHVAGQTGRNLPGRITHITALDPAAYKWYESNDRLGPDCAQYVEVIHTAIGNFGYSQPLGHADFYPNGGSNQPGCEGGCSNCASAFTCSHQKSYEFLADALFAEANGQQKYVGVQCYSQQDAVSQTCNLPGRAVFGSQLYPINSYAGIYSFRSY